MIINGVTSLLKKIFKKLRVNGSLFSNIYKLLLKICDTSTIFRSLVLLASNGKQPGMYLYRFKITQASASIMNSKLFFFCSKLDSFVGGKKGFILF